MRNEQAGIARVTLEEAKRRALALGQTLQYPEPASSFAEAIWPEHKMTAQGAGAAASRILKALEKDGRAGWTPGCDRASSRTRWGWWAR